MLLAPALGLCGEQPANPPPAAVSDLQPVVAVAHPGKLLYLEAGTVWTGTGPASSPGGVLIRGDTILHAGPPLKVPESARTLSLPKAYVVPAFLDAHTYLGTKNAKDRNERIKPIYPAFKIADSMEGAVVRGATLYDEGLLKAYTSPGPRALVGGMGAVIDLGRRRIEPGLMTLSISSEALQSDREPFALSGLAMLLREKVPAAVKEIEGTRLRIFARHPHEVETALAFSKERKARAVLVGVDRPDLIPDVIDPGEVIVIPRPTIVPGRLRRIARANEKGIRFAFASWAEDEWHVNTRFLASVAHGYGMSHEAALRAITVNAADACGLADAGVLKTGGRADLAVFAGDPLDLSVPLLFILANGKTCYASEGGVKP